jgi:hypothetical protein
VNETSELSKHGFAVVSYKPICLKSLCFLCGSAGQNSDDNYDQVKKNTLLLLKNNGYFLTNLIT